MGCCTSIAFCLLFIFNIIVWLAGIFIIAIGVIAYTNFSDASDLSTPIYYVIAIGCIIFVVAFFGCCGAITKSRNCLLVYACCLFVSVGVDIYVVLVLFNKFGEYKEVLKKFLEDTFTENLTLFNVFETTFKCCGTSGADSYQNILPFVPPTCCEAPVENVCAVDQAYDGCTGVVTDYFVDILKYGSNGIIGIIIVTLVIAFVSLYLAYRANKKNNNSIVATQMTTVTSVQVGR